MANTELKYVSLNGLSTFWTGVKDKLAISSVTINPTESDVKLTVSQTIGGKDCTINAATATTAGIMSAADKIKLTGIETGAQVNKLEKIIIAADNAEVPTAGNEKAAVLRITTDLDNVTAESDPLRPASTLAVVNYVKTSVSNAQSTINDAINNITASVATNAAAIATHAGRLTTLEATSTAHATAISNNSASITANASAIATNTANIATNTAAISDINDSITNITASVATNAADIATHAGRLTTLEATSTAHATAISNNTASIAANANAIALNTAAIEANAKAIGEEADARKQAIADLRKEILTDGTANDAINDAYDTLQEVANWISTSGTASKDATQIISELNAVTATASANAAAIATNAANIATNLASINSINDSITNITASVATNAATITAHATRLTTLETTSAAHTKAIEDNAKSITANANAIAVNTAAIEDNAKAIGEEADAREQAIADLTAVVNNTVKEVNFTLGGTNNEDLTIEVTYVNDSSTSVKFAAYTNAEINSIFESKA